MKQIFSAIILFCLFQYTCSALEISGEAGVVITADTNEIIYEKNAQSRLPMASTTKIMTAIVALEKSTPDAVVTVSANAERQEGSSIYLRRNDKIRMEDLLYGLMLNSGNDAAVAVAEYVSGSVEVFSDEMNNLAKKIGATNTSFRNPNGLDHEEHYTTAYDLAQITAYAMRNKTFREIVATKEKNAEINNAETLYFHNHNKLLKMYDGAVGVKTGFTKRSGRCLVSAAERNGVTLIAVTLNAPNDWNDHMQMLDYGFSKCSIKNIISENQSIKTINTADGEQLGVAAAEGVAITVVDGRLPESEVKLYLPEMLQPPIYKDEKLGEAEVYINNSLAKRIDVISERTVFARGRKPGDELMRVIKKWQKCYLQMI